MDIERIVDRIIEIPEDFHEAGTISQAALRKLHSATRGMTIKRSVETGCGKSTLLLSWISQQHTVFTLSGYENGEHSHGYEFVSTSSLLNSRVVEFVLGPTQTTLPQWSSKEPIQLVFMDGPHGYPFPELEYYHLYPRLEAGALLVVDDIHIPTIHNLFKFLCEDRMFSPEGVADKTAFLRRTDAPVFSPFGDHWWTQEYNLRHMKHPQPVRNWLHRVSRAILGNRNGERIRNRVRSSE